MVEATLSQSGTRPRTAKAATVSEFTKEGDPIIHSSGSLVLDPATGATLFSKNADHVAPIASITKLMTAMVVLDAKLPMEEPIEITRRGQGKTNLYTINFIVRSKKLKS